jgi:hypothetical protein
VNADPVFDQAARNIVVAVSVFLPFLYAVGLIFSLNSHYQLIEDEEHMIRELQSKEAAEPLPSSKNRGYSIGIHSVIGSAISQEAERSPALPRNSTPEDEEEDDTMSQKEERMNETLLVKSNHRFDFVTAIAAAACCCSLLLQLAAAACCFCLLLLLAASACCFCLLLLQLAVCM